MYSESYNGTNTPIFLLKKTESVAFQIEIKNTDGSTTDIATISPNDNSQFIHTFDNPGTYSLTFKLDNAEVTTKTIKVSPNAVLIDYRAELYSGTQYNLLGYDASANNEGLLYILSYKIQNNDETNSTIIYGLNNIQYVDEDGSYNVSYMTEITSDISISEDRTSAFETTGLNTTPTTKWIEEVNGSSASTLISVNHDKFEVKKGQLK